MGAKRVFLWSFFAFQSLAYVVCGVSIGPAPRPAPRMISSCEAHNHCCRTIAIGSCELPFAYSISQQTTTSLLLHSCTQPLHATDAQPHPPRCSNPTTRTAPYEQAPHVEWATLPPDRSPRPNTDSRSHTFESPYSSGTEQFPAFGPRRTRRSTARSASRVASSRSDPRGNVDVEARDELFS